MQNKNSRRLWFSIGTAAELIKIYALIHEAQKRKLDWYVLATGQSGVNFYLQYEDFQLPQSRLINLSHSTRDLKGAKEALFWWTKAAAKPKSRILMNFPNIEPSPDDYWFVHGDTISTLLGCVYAKRFGVPIVHVEAGMRSGSITSPFPEEATRRLVSKLADHHMVSDHKAEENLKKEGIIQNVINTGGNTVVDALFASLENTKTQTQKYVLANIHRFENLASESKWNYIVDLLIKVAEQHKVLFVMMPNTEQKLKEQPSIRQKLLNAKIDLITRKPFSEFAKLMHGAEFLISDGGSNQQECFYIGQACLIMRDRTESIEGIGSTCVISEFNENKVQEFLKNPNSYKRPPQKPNIRPTDIIFKHLGLK